MARMDSCAGCGGGIWPETPTYPYCEYCAAKNQRAPATPEPEQVVNESESTPETPADSKNSSGKAGGQRRTTKK